jgi:hypothetical protein
MACFAPYTYAPIQQPITIDAIEIEIVMGKTTKRQLVEMAGQPSDIDIYSWGETIRYNRKINVIYNITAIMKDGTSFSRSYEYFRVSISNGVINSFDGNDS